MTILQGLVIIAIILLAFAIVVSGMFHTVQSYSAEHIKLNILDCRSMYENISLLQLCYQFWGPEIDP